MIEREHHLPVKRQAELVGISRGSVYYQAEPVSEAELALMRRIDELHLEHPFAGSRMLRDFLRRPAGRANSSIRFATMRSPQYTPSIGTTHERLNGCHDLRKAQ